MKALILAGGQGDRLNHLTATKPKALIEVAGQALIGYILNFLNDPRVTEIGVVIGHQASSCSDFLKKYDPKIHVFETPHSNKGSILGMQCAHLFLDDDFLLCNADHIYPKRLLDIFLKQTKGITAACDFNRPLVADDMKIRRDGKGHLKEIHKQLKVYDGGYIGMTYCPRSKIALYFGAHETALSKLGPKACVEMALAELAFQEEAITIADTSGIRWLEVDTLDDLQKAEATLQKNPKFLD